MEKKFNLGRGPLHTSFLGLSLSVSVFLVSSAIFFLYNYTNDYHSVHNIFGTVLCVLILLSGVSGFFYLLLFLVAIANNSLYKYAKRVIDSGQIEPDYMIHNFFAGIILVDEKNKKILVNRQLRSFNDIKEINKKTVNKNTSLTIVFSSGEKPTEVVKIKDGSQGLNEYHRLCNSLGLVPA